MFQPESNKRTQHRPSQQDNEESQSCIKSIERTIDIYVSGSQHDTFVCRKFLFECRQTFPNLKFKL
jgi:hypothetical protein